MSSETRRTHFHPFRVVAMFLVLFPACLVVSEGLGLNFSHQNERLRELGILFEEARQHPADILYLGSSRTMLGVSPVEVEREYRRLRPDESMRGVNLGFELSDWAVMFSLLSRYLRQVEAPRVVALEVGLIDAHRKQHRLMKNFVHPGDLPALFGSWSFANWLELGLGVVARGPVDLAFALTMPDLDGQAICKRGGWVEKGGALRHILDRRDKVADTDLVPLLARRARGDINRLNKVELSRRFAKRVAELCDERGVRLVFVHIPQFMEPRLNLHQWEFYRRLGEVLEPDYPRLYRTELYREHVHVNREGAREFSAQIGRFLAGEPVPDIDAWISQERQRRQQAAAPRLRDNSSKTDTQPPPSSGL